MNQDDDYYAECGTATAPDMKFDYHDNGCPNATFPWAPGDRVCGFTNPEASNAQRLRQLDRNWCSCGNPSDIHDKNDKYYSCRDCGKLISVG